MTQDNFHHVGIVGAGQMGAGIAQVCATYGCAVTLVDSSGLQLEKALQGIGRSLDKFSAKGLLGKDQPAAILERLKTSPRLEDLSRSDLVIEAVSEVEELKVTLFQQLDQLTQSSCVLASNTSSISITKLARATQRPNYFIGLHFMNPVPLMKLVEIIPGMATDQTVVDRSLAFVKSLGKVSSMSQDYPGFVVNRILMPMINEAFTALMEGVAGPEAIDTGMTLGTNQPMGPLTLADFIGLDTCLAIMQVLHRGFGDSKYRPCPLLIKYVEAGFLGKKTGQGVYNYGSDGNKTLVALNVRC